MLSVRCTTLVKNELTKLGIQYFVVGLGEVEIPDKISAWQRDKIKSALLKSGLELQEDKKSILVQKIKNAIIELVYHSEETLVLKLSEYLSRKLYHDYTYLANVFSEVQGTTIEKFFISQKIGRVKELLVYNELTLTEIAYKMRYSSVAHLSTQFKKLTGLTPSRFKQIVKDKDLTLKDL
jgi:AraC-like DNA-binding protein